jgi:hypothetical protein
LNHLELSFTIGGVYNYQDFQLLNATSGRVGIFLEVVFHTPAAQSWVGVELGWSGAGVNAGAEKRLCHITSLCFILEIWNDPDPPKPWPSAPAVGSSTFTNSTPRIRTPNASNSRLWLSQPRKGVPSANLSMIINRRII